MGVGQVYGKYGVYRSRPRAMFDVLVLGGAYLVTFLPAGIDRWLVRATVLAYRTVLRQKVRHVATKMERLIGPEPPPRQTWTNLALAYWEMRSESHWMRARAMHRSEQPLEITLEGREHLEKALEGGKGVILWRMFFCSSHIPKRALAEAGHPMVHLSHWDHGNRGLGRAGLKVFAPRWIRAEVRYLRERVVLPDDESLDYLRRLLAALRDNQPLSIFGNLPGYRSPLPIEILGTKRLLATGAPALSRRTGAPLLTLRAVRLGPLRYRVIIDEPIEVDTTGGRAEFIESAIRQYAARVEDAVRRHPESWYRWSVYIEHR